MSNRGETQEAAVQPFEIPDHQLLRRIGGGSYGEVWLARSSTGTLRAVKRVHQQTFDSARPYDREFSGLLHFEPLSRSHEGLVDILQVGRGPNGDSFYYVMELADDAHAEAGAGSAAAVGPAQGDPQAPSAGKSGLPDSGGTRTDPGHLHSAIRNLQSYCPLTLDTLIRQRGGRLPVQECLAIARTLAGALCYLHEAGLVHRDIKPSNIIFVGGVPKLADIGLVARSDSPRTFVGTEGFVPPEGPGTPQADLYSLGKCLYEMAMGKDRLAFPSPPTQLAELPDRAELLALNDIISRACDPDPGERYSTAGQLLADLRALSGGAGCFHLRQRRLRWVRAGLWSVAALLAALLAVGIWPFFSRVLTPEMPARSDHPAAMEHPLIRINPSNLPPPDTERVALVNPDYLRAVKFGLLDFDGNYHPIADGSLVESGDGRVERHIWAETNRSPDYLSHLLANIGVPVDVYWSSNFPAARRQDYTMVVVQDPLMELDRVFDRSVEMVSPDLLGSVTNALFLERLDAYVQSGGNLLLLGDAVRLIEDGPGRLNYGRVVRAMDVTNQLSAAGPEVPSRWFFVRGQRYSGVGPEGTLQALGANNDQSGVAEPYSRVVMQERLDLPRALVWGETFYFPASNPPAFLRLKLEGEGRCSLTGATVEKPWEEVRVSAGVPWCGFVTCRNRRVGFLSSDAPFELRFRDFRGFTHIGVPAELKRETTPAGEAALLSFLRDLLDHDVPRMVLKDAAGDPYDWCNWTTVRFAGRHWYMRTNGCQVVSSNGQIRVVGTVATSGWGRGNGITWSQRQSPGSFTASVEFQVPTFTGSGPRLIYFGFNSARTRPCSVLFQPGHGYELQRFGPNSFHGHLPAFGDEDRQWHRLTLHYDQARRRMVGSVDDRKIAEIPMSIDSLMEFSMQAATDTAGAEVDVRLQNFQYQTGGAAAPSAGASTAGAAAP